MTNTQALIYDVSQIMNNVRPTVAVIARTFCNALSVLLDLNECDIHIGVFIINVMARKLNAHMHESMHQINVCMFVSVCVWVCLWLMI